MTLDAVIPRADARRPSLDAFLIGLVEAIQSANPERLGHLRANVILFVAGAARREARASVRSLAGAPPGEKSGWLRPQVHLQGRGQLYEICLRPLFFLRSRPEERVRSIAHELWHISARFDGALANSRRHRVMDSETFEGSVDEIVTRFFRAGGSPGLLAFKGEVAMQAWLSRPPTRIREDAARRNYSEQDLFEAILRLA